MAGHQIKSNRMIISLVLVSHLLLSACASQVQAEKLETPEVIIVPVSDEVAEPERSEDETINESKEIVSHEGARDIAVAFLVEKYSLEAPDEWFSQDQVPEGLLGASDFMFTSGAWVVRIKAPVVAPEYLVYDLEIDHVASGMRWKGEVDAWGALKETSASEPLSVLSAEDARDEAVAFILAEYGWDELDGWIEQSMKPIENAGVRQTFTCGAWVIQVDHYAAAPIVPGYHVIADHMSLVARWEGRISADGEIVEEAYVFEQ